MVTDQKPSLEFFSSDLLLKFKVIPSFDKVILLRAVKC
jgi:hypothetical protein